MLDFSDAAMLDQSLSLSAQLKTNQRLPSDELRCEQAIRSTVDCQTGVSISNDTGASSTATVSGRSSVVPEVCPKSNQGEPLAPQTEEPNLNSSQVRTEISDLKTDGDALLTVDDSNISASMEA